MTEISHEVAQVREQAKADLLAVGHLRAIKSNLDKQLAAMSIDPEALKEIIAMHIEEKPVNGAWVYGAIEELTEAMHGNDSLAKRFISLAIIERHADAICDTILTLHSYDNQPVMPMEQRIEWIGKRKLFEVLTKETTDIVAAFAVLEKGEAAIAVGDYVDAIEMAMNEPKQVGRGRA